LIYLACFQIRFMLDNKNKLCLILHQQSWFCSSFFTETLWCHENPILVTTFPLGSISTCSFKHIDCKTHLLNKQHPRIILLSTQPGLLRLPDRCGGVPTNSPREQWDPGLETCLIPASVTHWLDTAHNLHYN
jgi:hypothetical protein